MRSNVLLPRSDSLASAGSVVLDHMRTEVEELLEGQQVLIRLLAPLAKADEHEVLLQVPLLLGQRMQPGVLDRHRRLEGEALRAHDLVRREGVPAAALGED